MTPETRNRWIAGTALLVAALALWLAWRWWPAADPDLGPATPPNAEPAVPGTATTLPGVPGVKTAAAPAEATTPEPAPAAPKPAQRADFEFGKRLGLTVRGVVVDAHGRPAVKVPVYSTQERGDGRGEWRWTPRGTRRFHDGGKRRDITTSFVYSGEDGTFELLKEFIPDKPIVLRLDPGFLTRWRAGPGSQVTVQPGAEGVSLSLSEKFTIRLRVVDAVTRRPIPTARAGVWMKSPFATEWAGDSLRIFLEPGRRPMVVHAPGYEPRKITLQMPDPEKGEGESDALWPDTVELTRGHALAGTLVGASGKPVVREACVYLERCDPKVALDARPVRCTDPERDGSFNFGTLKPGTYRLVVISARHETFDLTAPVADLAANAVITLKPGTPTRTAGQASHDWAERRDWPVPLDSWYAPLAERLRILETIGGVRLTLEPGVLEALQRVPIYGLSAGPEPLAKCMAQIARSYNSETEEGDGPRMEFDQQRGVMRMVKK